MKRWRLLLQRTPPSRSYLPVMEAKDRKAPLLVFIIHVVMRRTTHSKWDDNI